MEEIKENEYIRTKSGRIGKVIGITNVTGQKRLKYLIEWKKGEAYYITAVTIKKHNKNIIKLLEKGDYINGLQVVEHAHEDGRLFTTYVYVGGIGVTTFEVYPTELKDYGKDMLETIVTHEQMKSIEYEV